MKRLLLSVLLLVSGHTVNAADPAAADSTVTGTWRWQFRMPDGTEVQPKIKLKQEGGRVTGTSSHRGGPDVAITNGVVNGKVVRFDVIRERNGIQATTHYEATLEGKPPEGHGGVGLELERQSPTVSFRGEACRWHRRPMEVESHVSRTRI
jgi:hypothetical protein